MRTYYMVPREFGRIRAYRPVGFNGGRRMPIDIQADSEAYVIKAEVPGLKAEDLKIEILDDVLTLHGEVSQEENGHDDYLLRELSYGSFSRKLRLPDAVDASKADAKIEDGVLMVRLPKAEETKPKVIKVKAR
jgi:HSP20 family protein